MHIEAEARRTTVNASWDDIVVSWLLAAVVMLVLLG